jgi:tRNA U34 5-carboxymethylaminomethyl modifying GTPase MnmE/TrmE
MADLSTTYMGVKLKNPLILGASNLVTKPEVVKDLEEAGIAAIVYKSLFEEQIQLESLQFDEELNEYANRNSEMGRIFPDLEHAGPKEHLLNLKKLKASTSVPVFASLNAIYEPSWVEYAKLLEETGIDILRHRLAAIVDAFMGNLQDSPSYITTVRQLHAVQRAKEALARFYTACDESQYEECLAFELQEAARALASIVGEITHDDVLDALFSKFCIGK